MTTQDRLISPNNGICFRGCYHTNSAKRKITILRENSTSPPPPPHLLLRADIPAAERGRFVSGYEWLTIARRDAFNFIDAAHTFLRQARKRQITPDAIFRPPRAREVG